MSPNNGRPRPGDQGAAESRAAGTDELVASVDAPAVEMVRLPHGLLAVLVLRDRAEAAA